MRLVQRVDAIKLERENCPIFLGKQRARQRALLFRLCHRLSGGRKPLAYARPSTASFNLSNSNTSYSRGANRARVIGPVTSSGQRGRRECRARRAHPQPRVRGKKAHELVTTGTTPSSGIPCAMVLRLSSCSPRGSGFLAPVIDVKRKLHRQLDASVEASGPHDFAVRPSIARPAMPVRPPHSHPTFRDGREASLLLGRETGEVVKVICPTTQGRI
jgi:hypothetical protein